MWLTEHGQREAVGIIVELVQARADAGQDRLKELYRDVEGLDPVNQVVG